MKKLSIFLFALFSVAVNAQTTFSGGIFNNTTWTLSNSPYTIDGNVVIFPGKTLTIEPGVIVNFVSDTTGFTTNMISLEVRGNLVAQGTLNNPIVFKSTSENGTNDWLGINVKSSQGGTFSLGNFQLKNSFYGLNADSDLGNSTFTFDNCVFEKNNTAIQLNAQLVYNNCRFEDNLIGQAVQYVSGSLTANNCEFINNFTGFTMVNDAINVTDCLFDGNVNGFIGSSGSVTNCTFKNNDFGIGQGGSIQMDNCIFTNNGVGAQSLSYSSISNSYFSDNELALEIGDNCSVINSEIYDNSVGLNVVANNMQSLNFSNSKVCGNVSFNLQNSTDKNFDAAGLCFCSSDSTMIENLLFDGYDDITKGLVNYTIYDDSCDVAVAAIVKVDLGSTAGLIENIEPQINYNYWTKQFSIAGVSSKVELDLYAASGAKVKSFEISEGSPSESIELTTGMYWVKGKDLTTHQPIKILIP